MSCLITGTAGFIGSHLAEKLISEDYNVKGIDSFTDYYQRERKLRNLSNLKNQKNFNLVEGDLTTIDLAKSLENVEYIFHLAAQPGVRKSWGSDFAVYVRDNILTSQRLFEAAKDYPNIKKVIYASSSSIYGDSERLPTPEDSIPRPNSPYGVTKLAAENLCNVYHKNFKLPTVALRFFTVYGPRQRPDMAFNKFITRISEGSEIEIYGDGTQSRDFTFCADTVSAISLAKNAEGGSTFNVGSGKSVSLNQAVSIIEELVGKKAKIVNKKTAEGDVKNTSADISRIRKLGYAPKYSLREGLAKQVEWQLHGTLS